MLCLIALNHRLATFVWLWYHTDVTESWFITGNLWMCLLVSHNDVRASARTRRRLRAVHLQTLNPTVLNRCSLAFSAWAAKCSLALIGTRGGQAQSLCNHRVDYNLWHTYAADTRGSIMQLQNVTPVQGAEIKVVVWKSKIQVLLLWVLLI